MRAVVYHGPGRKSGEEVPKPTIREDTDAVVRVGRDDAVKALNDITSGLGADVAVEAVGVPEAFELCTRLRS
jgi:threonine dehydrogenase-like Zn-dependent dehydrogenase